MCQRLPAHTLEQSERVQFVAVLRHVALQRMQKLLPGMAAVAEVQALTARLSPLPTSPLLLSLRSGRQTLHRYTPSHRLRPSSLQASSAAQPFALRQMQKLLPRMAAVAKVRPLTAHFPSHHHRRYNYRLTLSVLARGHQGTLVQPLCSARGACLRAVLHLSAVRPRPRQLHRHTPRSYRRALAERHDEISDSNRNAIAPIQRIPAPVLPILQSCPTGFHGD